MRIEDLLIETNLEEGPGWDRAKAGLKGIAQGASQVAQGAIQGAPGVIGGAARGVGAVAGGAAGAWDKAKQGFQAGRAAVNGTAGQPAQSVAPAQQTQVDPTMDPQEEPAQAAPNFNNQLAGGQQKISVGGTNNPTTFQNEPGQEVQTGTVPTPADIRNAAAPTSNETDPRNNVTTTNAPAAGKRVGVPAGTQAVDNAMSTVNTVRADRRQKVIDYAQDKLAQAEQELAAIRKNAGIKTAPAATTSNGTDLRVA